MKLLTAIRVAPHQSAHAEAIDKTFFRHLPNAFYYGQPGTLPESATATLEFPINLDAKASGDEVQRLYRTLLERDEFDYLLSIPADTYVSTSLLELLLKKLERERPSLRHYMGARIVAPPRLNSEDNRGSLFDGTYCDARMGYFLSRRALEIVSDFDDQRDPPMREISAEGLLGSVLQKRGIFPTRIPPEPFTPAQSAKEIIARHNARNGHSAQEAELGRAPEWRPQEALRSILLPPWLRTQREQSVKNAILPPGSDAARHHDLLKSVADTEFIFPQNRFRGRGIVICGGGSKYFPSVWVCINMLRHVGCDLPIELWHLGPSEMSPLMRSLVEPLGVQCVDAYKVREQYPVRILRGWELKCYALMHSKFEEVLLLDADNVAIRNPAFLFNTQPYQETGAIFWPDRGRFKSNHIMWAVSGVSYRNEPEFESGQMVVQKRKCWRALNVAMHLNEFSDFYYRHMHGDKDTFRFGWHVTKTEYAMAAQRCHDVGLALYQSDFDGNRLFQHRSDDKWRVFSRMRRLKDFREETVCLQFLHNLENAIRADERQQLLPVDCPAPLESESTEHADSSQRVSVRFRGPVNAYSGYGLHSLAIVSAIQAQGYQITIAPTELSERFAPLPSGIRDLVVSPDEPHEWELLLHPPDLRPTVGKKTLFFTMWEASRLPQEWVAFLNEAEHIVVPCEWNATCFSAAGVDRPIHIIPLGIKTDVFTYQPMDLTGPCVFGAAGKMAGGGKRKGLNEIITLFKAAFPSEGDVRLKIKAFPDCGVRFDSDPRIHIDATYWDEAQLASWYQSLTCFVSLSRSEGWGLMPHQAMATGRPCIAMAFGGHREFFTEHVGYPLKYRLTPAGYNYTEGGVWAEPDEFDVIEKLRAVYRDRLRARDLGITASKFAHTFPWDRSCRMLLDLMVEIGMVEKL